MVKIKFRINQQKQWLISLKEKRAIRNRYLAKIAGVTERTIRSWINEETTVSETAMLLFCQKFNISIPKNINRLDDYWYLKKCAKKGALARMKLHGLLGNIETRRKGGIISQQRRRENPKHIL